MTNFNFKSFFSSIVMLTLLVTDQSLSQTDVERRDHEMLSMLKHESISLSGLIQAVGRYSFEDNNFNGGRTFQVGNARLSISGLLDSSFEYRFQFNIAREPNLLDAFIGYYHSDKFRIRAGAHKSEFSGDLLPHPGLTDFIGRTMVVGALLKPRDIGVSFFGDIDRFRYYIGIYNGSGLTTNTDNRFLYQARFSFSPETGGDENLRIGLNTAYGEHFNTSSGSTNIQLAGNRFVYGGDVRYEDDFWIFASEILIGDLEVTNYIAGPEEQITGYYFTGGYKFSDNTQILARWDHLRYREANASSNQLVLGLTHYMTDMFSFKINLLSVFDTNIDNQMGLSTSLQLHF